MKLKLIVGPVLVVLAVIAVVSWAARSPLESHSVSTLAYQLQEINNTARRVDRHFESIWGNKQLKTAEPAEELQVLRRLSLVLHGTIPSLEEIREFEADTNPDRLQHWTARLLNDQRFADYFAERLARGFVGIEGGSFITFRRDRFVGWLSEQLKHNVPYNQMVRELVSGTGLWTGKPATNFITIAYANNELDENKLAGRAVRAFLGQRIDCAQCHDHPFDHWTQSDFAGLAAHFTHAKLSIVGVEDKPGLLFQVSKQWQRDLDTRTISKELRQQFSDHNAKIRKDDVVEFVETGKSWLIRHSIHDYATRFILRLEDGQLNLYEQKDDDKVEFMYQGSRDWQSDLDDGNIPDELRDEFSEYDNPLTKYDRIEIDRSGSGWLIQRPLDNVNPLYVIRLEDDHLKVYDYTAEFRIQDRQTLEDRVFAPAVPFHPEWLPAEGTRRERLAGWITHPLNRRFERAIANRVWGLMFGRAYYSPVDDVPDPDHPDHPKLKLLDILGDDFREHGYDLQRLIHVIAASRPFRIDSTHTSQDPDEVESLEKAWAIFPLSRLRPEQVIGSMLQASSVKTIDQNSHLVFRTIKYLQTSDFVQEYGDLGENELDERVGTIPQALLRMNGKLPNDMADAGPFSAPGRIANMSSTDKLCLDNCFLVCLSRRPTQMEIDHFLPLLNDRTGEPQVTLVGDIFWTLYNSPEFSWNH